MTGSGELPPPFASVVVAAYDAATTLGEQLAALAGQDTDAFEVLVCDNGSTDDTVEVARSWQDRVPGLRVVDAARLRGPGGARNIGAALASSGILLFCDADDVVAPGWVRVMTAALHRHELVAGPGEISTLNPVGWGPETSAPAIFAKPYGPDLPVAASRNMGIRKAVFDEVGGFDLALTIGEDVDLSWRVQLAGHALVAVPEAVVHVRMRGGIRPTFRQEYRYARADRQLAFRYAKVAAGSAGRPSPAPEPTDAAEGSRSAPAWGRRYPGRALWDLRRFLAEALRLRHPGYPTTVARRLGRWCGARWGRVDRSMAQIEPRS